MQTWAVIVRKRAAPPRLLSVRYHDSREKALAYVWNRARFYALPKGRRPARGVWVELFRQHGEPALLRIEVAPGQYVRLQMGLPIEECYGTGNET